MAFDIQVPDILRSAEQARALVDRANRAVEEGARSLRFHCAQRESLPLLLRAIRDLAPRDGLEVELLLPEDQPVDPRLGRAARLAGAHLRVATPAEQTRRHDPAYLIDHPENLPHDFLVLNRREQLGQSLLEALIRVTYRCNERCGFCWLHQGQTDVAPEQIHALLRELAARGLHRLTLSGGEPTLFPGLAELIAGARDCGVPERILQTNGVRLADPARLRALLDAGLTEVFLALHGHRAELSDAITGLVGGFDKTRRALRNLLAEDVVLVLDHVVTAANVAHLPDFAEFLLAEAAAAGRGFGVNFAVAQPMGRFEKDYLASTPRLGALREALIRAFTILKDSPVTAFGFTSACGPPLCAVAGHPEFLGPPEAILDPPGLLARDFVKGPVCAACGLSASCRGLRRLYAERFGLDELVALG